MILKKNVAIATINKSAYSETFIKAQINLLPAKLVLYGGWLPVFYGNHQVIANRYKTKLNKLFKLVFKRPIFNSTTDFVSVLKQHQIDVVLAQYGLAGAALLEICKKADVSLVVHFHGFDASVTDVLTAHEDAYKAMFVQARKIIAVSHAMKSKLISIGCPEEKIALIPYGPDPIFFSNQPDFSSNTFFAIGRFVDKKAPYLTLMAFNEVVKEFPDAQLRMAGAGELLNTCKNMAKALGIEDHVIFLGIVKPDIVCEELLHALAFVQHSVVADNGDSEGTPVAVLEAQAAGLPVIATFHAGIPDVVLDGETGLLVEELDIQDMKAAMITLLKDKEKAKDMGRKAKTRMEQQFTMDIYINALRSVLNEN
ncbi:glycosyltransferase [Bizionia psychrotolerans]|uniref:glycosyltransferase n=1 Tax=Bizionia psychrotolerans TaxID=1492901 RepID=UPI0006524ECA|nr:glycosyltransferase [Bizionia psychrotolerans]